MAASGEADKRMENNKIVVPKRKERHKKVILIGVGITVISIAIIVGIILGVSMSEKKDSGRKRIGYNQRTTQNSGKFILRLLNLICTQVMWDLFLGIQEHWRNLSMVLNFCARLHIETPENFS